MRMGAGWKTILALHLPNAVGYLFNGGKMSRLRKGLGKNTMRGSCRRMWQMEPTPGLVRRFGRFHITPQGRDQRKLEGKWPIDSLSFPFEAIGLL